MLPSSSSSASLLGLRRGDAAACGGRVFRAYAKAISSVAKERGWRRELLRASTRNSGPDGALLIGA